MKQRLWIVDGCQGDEPAPSCMPTTKRVVEPHATWRRSTPSRSSPISPASNTQPTTTLRLVDRHQHQVPQWTTLLSSKRSRSTALPRSSYFCKKWYQDQQIVHYLSKWLPDLHATQLNHALARDRILKLCFENTTYNEHGFYKHRVQIKKKRYVFYFVSKDKAPEFHSAAQKWLQEAEGNQIRKTSNRQKQQRMLSPAVENAKQYRSKTCQDTWNSTSIQVWNEQCHTT